MSHRNARLTPHGRLLLCERVEVQGWKLCEAPGAPSSSLYNQSTKPSGRPSSSPWLNGRSVSTPMRPTSSLD